MSIKFFTPLTMLEDLMFREDKLLQKLEVVAGLQDYILCVLLRKSILCGNREITKSLMAIVSLAIRLLKISSSMLPVSAKRRIEKFCCCKASGVCCLLVRSFCCLPTELVQ